MPSQTSQCNSDALESRRRRELRQHMKLCIGLSRADTTSSINATVSSTVLLKTVAASILTLISRITPG